VQPGSLDALHPQVDPRDAGTLAELLILKAPPKTRLLGVGEMISWNDFAAIWADVLGMYFVRRSFPRRMIGCEMITL
jgi:hypothetical protein